MMSENEDIGVQISPAQMQKQLDEQKKEQQQNSRFRQIDPGKTALLKFTGNAFEREVTYEGKIIKKFDFELEDKTPSGVNKVFSVGSKSAAARELVKLLLAGKRLLSVGRTGEKESTRYTISEVE